MKALQNMMLALGTFFMALNGLGGIISGVWLAILGKWSAIIIGLVAVFSSHYLISLALLPTLALGASVVPLAKKGARWGIVMMGFLSNAYIALVMAAWSLLVLMIFASQADSRASLIALLIWSYGVAMGPWQFLHSKDEQSGTGEGSALLTFFAQLAFVVMVLVGVFFSASVITMGFVFLGVMTIAVLLQTVGTYVELDPIMGESEISTEKDPEWLERLRDTDNEQTFG